MVVKPSEETLQTSNFTVHVFKVAEKTPKNVHIPADILNWPGTPNEET